MSYINLKIFFIPFIIIRAERRHQLRLNTRATSWKSWHYRQGVEEISHLFAESHLR